MKTTLSKFKRLQNRLAGSQDQSVEIPYEVECDCGATIRGIRRATWIESECPKCAERVFILPINVYPSTQSVPSEVLGGTFKERLSTVTGEIIRNRKAAKAKKKQRGSEATTDSDATASAPKKRFKLKKPTLPKIDVRRLITRTFTPFRLIMLSVIATVGLTGWFLIQKQQTEKAQQTWLESTEQIQQKLDDADLVGLLPDLERAIEAGTVLGKDGPDFRLLSNLQRETRGLDELSATGLLDVFHNCYNQDNALVSKAPSIMKKACQSGSFLFDGVAVPSDSSSSGWYVDFPATPGLHPVSIQLPDFPFSDSDPESSGDGVRIVFISRLEVETSPSKSADGQWVLQASPDDFAVLTHDAHLSKAGLPLDAELLTVIENQKAAVQQGRFKPTQPAP